MKVEYEYYSDEPSLFVGGTDFLNALENKYEFRLLQAAVEGYSAAMHVDAHFSDEANDAIKSWVTKSSKVIYTTKNSIEECTLQKAGVKCM